MQRRESHSAILRLSRDDAARTPVRAATSGGVALGDKAASGSAAEDGSGGDQSSFATVVRVATKRLRGVAFLVAAGTGGTGQSKVVAVTLNIVCYLQVGVGGEGRGPGNGRRIAPTEPVTVVP
jgi:hypothetical protein